MARRLDQLARCRFMGRHEFSDGIKAIAGKKVVIGDAEGSKVVWRDDKGEVVPDLGSAVSKDSELAVTGVAFAVRPHG